MRTPTVLLLTATCALMMASTAIARSPGVAWIPFQKNDKIGYINAKGAWMVPPKFAEGKRFSNGLAAVLARKGDGSSAWGYIDGGGKMIVAPKYDRAMPFRNGLALVGSNGCAWINDEGKVRIRFNGDSCGTFAHGLAHVLRDGKWGYVGLGGGLAIPLAWDRAWQFVDARGRVMRDGLYGFIDTAGRSVVEPRYLDAHDFSDGMAAVLTDDGWGFVNRKGRLVIPHGLEDVDRRGFNQGLCAAFADGQWGYVNKSGQWKVKPQYSWAGRFNQNRAPVSIDGLLGMRTGYINPWGAWAIQAKFEDGEPFRHGVAIVTKGDDTIAINRRGETLKKVR